MNTNKRIRRWGNGTVFIIFAIFAMCLPAIVLFIYRSHFHGSFSTESAEWAEFGEYFGGVLGAIFGPLGFLALVWTVLEQRKELKGQRDHLQRQNFESTFFQMLQRFSDVVTSTQYRFISPLDGEYTLAQGRDALRGIYAEFLRIYSLVTQGSGVTRLVFLQNCYEVLYEDWQQELGHYFRTLYHVFKLIDTAEMTIEDKTKYASIARSQLSAYELSLIFYNGLSKEGQQFKYLIEKYGVLKHIHNGQVLEIGDLKDRELYKETAFMNFADRSKQWNGIEPEVSYD